jgi:isochorismate hydrolase
MQKEDYLAPEKAAEMLAVLGTFRRRHPLTGFQPARAALLVLDMQAYFLEPASHAFVPASARIFPGIQAAIDIFDQHRQPIIFTRHVNTPADAGMMGLWWKDVISPEAPLSAISPVLDTSKGVVIAKTQYDAFYGTALEEILRARAVEQVVICGVMTHLCCETTARSAFMRGFQVFFTVDGTATYTEAFHRAALLNLSHGFAVPVLLDEIKAAF